MNRLLITAVIGTMICLSGCGENPDDNNQNKSETITLNKEEVVFTYQGGDEALPFTTANINAEDLTATVSKSASEWCSASISGNILTITAAPFGSYNETRKATVTLKSTNVTKEIKVTQNNNPFYVAEDIKYKVKGGTTSSEELSPNTNNAFTNSYDGSTSTIWHSNWAGATFPVTITYDLENAEILDYILYTPRREGSNGIFKKANIYISYASNPNNFSLVKSMTFDGTNTPTKIEFPSRYNNVATVKFEITEGVNGYASCAEMEFFKKTAEDSAPYADIPVGQSGFCEPVEKARKLSNGVMYLNTSDGSTTVGKVFFRAHKQGKVKVQVKARSPQLENKLDVKLGEYGKSVNIAKGSQFEWITVLENVELNQTSNYVHLALSNPGFQQVEVESVRIIGEPSVDLEWSNNPTGRRNAVSVHLTYSYALKNAEWYYNEVTIPSGFDKPPHSYYMVNGFSQGYSGIQVRDHAGANSARWIIFSVWNTEETDDTDYWAEVKKIGTGVQTSSFGGEGTGARTWREYEWETDVTYCFLLQGRVSGTSTYYSLFWKKKTDTDWTFHATVKSPYNGRYLSDFYSFVENYSGDTGQYQRKAKYANQWVKNSTTWEASPSAIFTSDENIKYRNDIGAVATDNGYFLWNGGFLAKQGTVDKSVSRTISPNTAPVSDEVLTSLYNISYVAD